MIIIDKNNHIKYPGMNIDIDIIYVHKRVNFPFKALSVAKTYGI